MGAQFAPTIRPVEMSLSRTRFYILFVLALLAAATLVRAVDPFFVRALRLIAFDSYQQLAPQSYDARLPVRIVDIDEESLAKLGQWPWPRTKVRDLLVELTGKGAVVVGFDILFAEPDRTSVEEIVKHLPPAQAALLAEKTAGEPTNDEAFAVALKQTPSVLATSLGSGANAAPPAKAGFAVAGDDPRRLLPSYSGAAGNLPILDAAARGIGAINWIPDRDQIVRRAPLMFRVGDALIPAFAAELLRVAQGASSYVLKAANASGETAFGKNTGLNHIKIGNLEIPTDADGAVFLKFRPSNPAAYLPAWKVLSGEVPREDIEGRIILVGTSAPGLLDLRATPLDAAVSGVEIHAQVLEHILAGRSLTRPDYALALEEAVIVGLGMLLALILPRISASTAATIGVWSIVALFVGAWIAFRRWGLLLDPMYPALAVGCMTAGITFQVYRRVEAQRGEIRAAFGRYLAPAVIEEIIANPDKLELGGEVRELTLMFCDVRNFTSISEHLSAVELTHFINALLTPLSEIILAHRGTIDKYMGDAIMAFWNAPLDEPQHAAHACRAALEMAARMEALNRDWEEQAARTGRPFRHVNIGIGINTGQCCVGNLGSTYRFDYSAVGDEVNVTSRLEGLTKLYGVTAVVGEATLAKSGKQFPALELDVVAVKGRTRSTRVFTFLELLSHRPDRNDDLQRKHGELLVAYRARQWDDAERLLAQCQEFGIARLATYYSLFAARIAALRKTPPPPDWDGSFAMTEK
jgi:adenylate cyclase